uniref:Uncharacterized protein n=1 Tax=Prolemur simus TaxID=1328070 RepID=A0A8C9A7B5_PROSS
MLLPFGNPSTMLPTPIAFRRGSSEADLAGIHSRYAPSGAFLCCSRRFYLISWGCEQGIYDSAEKVSYTQIRSASARASVLLQQKGTKGRCNVRADIT